MSKYIQLKLKKIRRDFPQVWARHEKYFEITPMIGKIPRAKMEPGQLVISGDYKTFHFLLTKK